MNEQKIRTQVHNTVDQYCAKHGVEANPYLAQRVLNVAHQESLNMSLSGLQTASGQRNPLFESETGGNKMNKDRCFRLKKLPIGLIFTIVLMLISFTALAYTVINVLLSPKVNAYTVANQALEEKYELTPSMLGFFEHYSRGNDEEHLTVYYEPRFEEALASKLGVYRVSVTKGQVESTTWSLDGMSTEGGFEAEAWGAEQLGEMLRITSVTHDTSRFQRKACGEEVDLYEGMEPRPDDASDHEFPVFDQQVEAQIAQYQQDVSEAGKGIEAQSRFTRDELIELGRQGIIAAYRLNPEQQQRLDFDDDGYSIAYYSTVGADQHPTFNMTFESWSDDGWQEGDGVYRITVNVLDGTVEYLEYDTTLDGNG